MAAIPPPPVLKSGTGSVSGIKKAGNKVPAFLRLERLLLEPRTRAQIPEAAVKSKWRRQGLAHPQEL